MSYESQIHARLEVIVDQVQGLKKLLFSEPTTPPPSVGEFKFGHIPQDGNLYMAKLDSGPLDFFKWSHKDKSFVDLHGNYYGKNTSYTVCWHAPITTGD